MTITATTQSFSTSRAFSQSTQASSTASSAQPFRLSKITKTLVGLLALQRGASAQLQSLRSVPTNNRALQSNFSLTASLTGTRNVTATTRSALSAPFEYSVSPDATRLQIYDLQGKLVSEGQPMENSVANQPYRVVAHQVPGGTLTGVVQDKMLDLTLWDSSGGRLDLVARVDVTAFNQSAIDLSTLGYSHAGLAYSADGQLSNSNTDDSFEATNHISGYTTCKLSEGTVLLNHQIMSGTDQLDVEHVLPLFGLNHNSEVIPDCQDWNGVPNVEVSSAVAYRSEEDSIRLALANSWFDLATHPFEMHAPGQPARLSHLSFSTQDYFVALVMPSTAFLFAYSEAPLWFEDPVKVIPPADTALDIDVPLVVSNDRILGAGTSAEQPVLVLFVREGEGFASGQKLDLPFLNADAANKIIGLNADANQVFLLVAATKTNGAIEHQNWRVNIQQASSSMVPSLSPVDAPVKPPVVAASPSFRPTTPLPVLSPMDRTSSPDKPTLQPSVEGTAEPGSPSVSLMPSTNSLLTDMPLTAVPSQAMPSTTGPSINAPSTNATQQPVKWVSSQPTTKPTIQPAAKEIPDPGAGLNAQIAKVVGPIFGFMGLAILGLVLERCIKRNEG